MQKIKIKLDKISMLIGNAELSEHKGRYYYASAVSVDNKNVELPPQVWFAVEGDEYRLFSKLGDAFLIGLLPVAMKLGEDIEISDPVSSAVAHGIISYVDILCCWWPDVFKPIKVKFTSIEYRKDEKRPQGVGVCFSGGADSFYSLLKHLEKNEPVEDFRITHALMINGFDQIADYSGDGISQEMFSSFAPMLERLGVKPLMISNNFKLFRACVFKNREKIFSFGSLLMACIHALSPIFGRFYISGNASWAYEDLFPSGSHPVLDNMLSSDQLQIIHECNKEGRAGKIQYICDNNEVKNYLRVCFRPFKFEKGTGKPINCGKCEKCVRTIIVLDILNRRSDFDTFPLDVPISQYQRPELLAHILTIFLKETLELANSVGKKDWVRCLEQALLLKQTQE
jgi:hypothetical protein